MTFSTAFRLFFSAWFCLLQHDLMVHAGFVGTGTTSSITVIPRLPRLSGVLSPIQPHQSPPRKPGKSSTNDKSRHKTSDVTQSSGYASMMKSDESQAETPKHIRLKGKCIDHVCINAMHPYQFFI